MSSFKGDKEQTLAEFRRQVEGAGIIHEGDTIGTDDETLLRYLRARNFDIQKAKAMLAKSQLWRATVEGVGLDALYDEIDPFDYPEREVVFKYWPLWFHKTDKLGRPVNIQSFGALNIVELRKHVNEQRHWRAFLANCEALTREVLPGCSKATGSDVSAAYCIVDLKGFTLSQFWQIKGIVRDCFQLSQDYYPETMGRVAVINAPSAFTIIWNVIRPWLAPATVAKVDIIGYNYTKRLLEDIDTENLPTRFGGSCTCEEMGGCLLSSAGPWLDGRVYTGHGKSKFRQRLNEKDVGTDTSLDKAERIKIEDEGCASPRASNDLKPEEHSAPS